MSTKKSNKNIDKYGLMTPREWLLLDKGDLMVQMVESSIYIDDDLDVNGNFIYKMMKEYGNYVRKECETKNV